MPFLRVLMTLVLMLTGWAAAAEPVTVTDIAGRTVTLPQSAQRIVLGDGRHMAVLGMLMPDPVSRVVGWRQDKSLDAPTMAAYRAKFPAIDAIGSVGAGNRGLSSEAVIALEPDLLVLSLSDLNDSGTARARELVEAAGIPIVYVDFFTQPLANSIPSLRILGTLTGTSDRAEAFAAFYDEHLARVRDRLASANPVKPRVFFHVHAAPKGCCSTAGTGIFNDLIDVAGGHNVGADILKGVMGDVSLESVIAADPDIYVATGGTHMASRGGLVLGSAVDATTARQSFDTLIAAPGLSSLRAVEDGRVAGVWHLFNDSPSHIALIEYLAKLFHPELFADLDPDATMLAVQQDFAPVAVDGTWWVGGTP